VVVARAGAGECARGDAREREGFRAFAFGFADEAGSPPETAASGPASADGLAHGRDFARGLLEVVFEGTTAEIFLMCPRFRRNGESDANRCRSVASPRSTIIECA
jgi:hypothetical protein